MVLGHFRCFIFTLDHLGYFSSFLTLARIAFNVVPRIEPVVSKETQQVAFILKSYLSNYKNDQAGSGKIY